MGVDAKAEFSHRDNEGKASFLGRDVGSWLRIMGFYLVYYSFLAILFLTFITTYKSYLPPVGGNPPKIVTRVDQPGASAWPFHGIESSIDGDNSILDISTSLKNKHSKLYVAKMVEFLEKYTTKGNETSECGAGDVETKTCSIANAKLLTKEMVEEGITTKKPIFTVSLNKIVGWKPHNRNLDNAEKYNDEDMGFKKDSVYFRCYESDLNGAEISPSNFKVKYLGEKGLDSKYFPYMSNDKKDQDKVRYQKPFIIGQIEPLTDTAWSEKSEEHKFTSKLFRCVVDADNIESPKVGKEFYDNPDVMDWSNDLTKLRIGYVQFGIEYVEDDKPEPTEAPETKSETTTKSASGHIGKVKTDST